MRLFAAALFLLSSVICRADRFLNLGFELRATGSNKPLAWDAGGNGYTTSLDSTIKHSGKYSLKMEGSGKTENDYAMCSAVFPAQRAKGTEIKFRAFIRTDHITDGSATLWFLVNGKKGKLALENLKDSPDGTTDWNEYSLTVGVSDSATNVTFGCALSGNGKAWFDDLQLFINGTKYDDNNNLPREPAKSEVAGMRSAVTPVRSLELNSDDKDLEPLTAVTRDAKVVALGEVTHGSSEIFKLKARMVRHLIEKEGFDVFALEANMPEAYKLNKYVIDGKGDPKELIRGMYFWIWDTEEMLALVNWMKEYNAKHIKKVSFTGFDMQYAAGSFEEIKKECRKYNNVSLINSLPLLDTALANFNKKSGHLEELTISEREFFLNEWQILRDFSAEYITDKPEREWMEQNIRLLEQYTTDIHHAQRNEFMAENFFWIRNHNPGSKMIIWAHNAHIRKKGGDMGSVIVKELQDDYVSIACSFYQGTYTGYGNNGVATYTAQTATPYTYEYNFHQAGIPMFLLDLHRLSGSDPTRKWLSGEHEFRRTGASPMYDEFEPVNLPENFDAVAYIDQSSNSTLLHPHKK